MKDKNEKIPKDLGLVVKPKGQIFWERIALMAEKEIEDCKNTIILQDEILKVAKRKIETFK